MYLSRVSSFLKKAVKIVKLNKITHFCLVYLHNLFIESIIHNACSPILPPPQLAFNSGIDTQRKSFTNNNIPIRKPNLKNNKSTKRKSSLRSSTRQLEIDPPQPEERKTSTTQDHVSTTVPGSLELYYGVSHSPEFTTMRMKMYRTAIENGIFHINNECVTFLLEALEVTHIAFCESVYKSE
jgi:hypothetical protein